MHSLKSVKTEFFIHFPNSIRLKANQFLCFNQIYVTWNTQLLECAILCRFEDRKVAVKSFSAFSSQMYFLLFDCLGYLPTLTVGFSSVWVLIFKFVGNRGHDHYSYKKGKVDKFWGQKTSFLKISGKKNTSKLFVKK